MRKVFHVELHRPDGETHHFFFGSKRAICNILSPEELGIGYKYLCNLDLMKEEYHGRKATIRMGWLFTSQMLNQRNRGDTDQD